MTFHLKAGAKEALDTLQTEQNPNFCVIVSIFADAILDEWIQKTFPEWVQVYFLALSTVFTETGPVLPIGKGWRDQKPDISVEIFYEKDHGNQRLKVTFGYKITEFGKPSVMTNQISSFSIEPDAEIFWCNGHIPFI